MKRSLVLSLLVVGVAVVGMLIMPAGASAQYGKKTGGTTHKKTPKAPKTTTPKTNETYVIMQTGEEYKVIRAADITTSKKQADEDYKDQTKKWEKAKKDDPDLPKPVKAKILTKKYKTQQDAQDAIEKLKEKAAEKPEAEKTDPNEQ